MASSYKRTNIPMQASKYFGMNYPQNSKIVDGSLPKQFPTKDTGKLAHFVLNLGFFFLMFKTETLQIPCS